MGIGTLISNCTSDDEYSRKQTASKPHNPSNQSTSAEPKAPTSKRVAKHGKEPVFYKNRIKYFIRKAAKDPDSLVFESISNVQYDQKDGWIVKCTFRGKNSFGGYERDTNWFVLRCEAPAG